MRLRLAGSALTVLAVAAFATFAATGLAAKTVSIQGSMPNGGCGPVQSVNVATPSRIIVHVSATAAENGPPATGAVYTQFLNASGAVLASGPTEYKAATAGSYGVRVCSDANPENPSVLQYSGDIALLPPTALVSTATGKAGIRAHATIVWVTVNAKKGGQVSMRVDDALHKVHLGASAGLKAIVSVNKVTITGKGMTLVVTGHGVQQHVAFHSRTYNASGNVLRGAITIA
jgi:hypothetical protein